MKPTKRKGKRPDGFYWVQFRDSLKWTVAKYTGSRSYPWDMIARESAYGDKEVKFIGPKIEPPKLG